MLLLRGLMLLLVQVQLKVTGLPYLEVAPEAALAVRLQRARLRDARGIGAVGHFKLLMEDREEWIAAREASERLSLPLPLVVEYE